MSLFEKVAILGSLASIGVYSVYAIFKPKSNKLSVEEV
jgi:hypothetical protein